MSQSRIVPPSRFEVALELFGQYLTAFAIFGVIAGLIYLASLL